MTECKFPGTNAPEKYGTGRIKFTQKSFCSNGVCKDVAVCQVMTKSGDENYYIPLNETINISWALVFTLITCYND